MEIFAWHSVTIEEFCLHFHCLRSWHCGQLVPYAAMREFRSAFKIFWIVISLVTITMLITPYLLSADQIARVTPRCERKTRAGRECFCCGMTTAFIHIAYGRFSGAAQSNRGAVPLYAGFFCNGLGLLGNMGLAVARSRRRRML